MSEEENKIEGEGEINRGRGKQRDPALKILEQLFKRLIWGKEYCMVGTLRFN